ARSPLAIRLRNSHNSRHESERSSPIRAVTSALEAACIPMMSMEASVEGGPPHESNPLWGGGGLAGQRLGNTARGKANFPTPEGADVDTVPPRAPTVNARSRANGQVGQG